MSDKDKYPVPESEEKALEEKILREQPQQASVPCNVCLKEIPKSLAHIEEAEDYVLYFCGLDCFDKWEHQNQQTKKAKEKK